MIIIKNVVLIIIQTVTFHLKLKKEIFNILSLFQIFTRKMYVHKNIFLILMLINIIKKVNVHKNLFFENDENEKIYKND